jgi:competence protein ComEC
VNLAAVPLTGLIVPIGFLTLASGLLFPALGKLLAVPLAWITLLLVHTVQWFAHFSRWSYRIPDPSVWVIAVFFVSALLVAGAFRMSHPMRRNIVRVSLLAWMASALLVAIYPFGPRWAQGKLEVSVLDVGQGDSLFVVFPSGKTMLIDGGGASGGFPGHELSMGIDPGEEAVSPYLWSRGFQKLDVVALTHAHQDHLGGLTAILENFRVGTLWIGREVSSPTLAKLEEMARARRIPIEHELRGKLFSRDGVDGAVLWPGTAGEENAAPAKNNDSLVLQLRYGNRSLLLTGDAEKQAEKEILAENPGDTLRADVLKVGHHGSKNSTSLEFLSSVRPQVGIISAGEGNPYGHPNGELLDRLANANVRVLRTDRDGAIHILTDGTRLEITCFAGCPDAARVETSMQAEVPNQKHGREKQYETNRGLPFVVFLVLCEGKRARGISGKFCGRQPREEQRDGANIFVKGCAMTRAEFVLFTPHDNRIEQREIAAKNGEGDPGARGNTDGESKNRASKIQGIARVSVRTGDGQDFLFVKIARGGSTNP